MEELLTKFGIDWKLIITQVVNFGILFFLLKKFAYKPVLGMLKERRDKIAAGMKDADDARKEKLEIDAKREGIIATARKEGEAIMKSAKDDAVAEAEETVKRSREKIMRLAEEAKHVLEEEKRRALSEIRAEAASFVARASAKVLEGVSDKKIDESLIKSAVNETR